MSAIQCNELGLDPTSLGFILSMAMECVEQGLLDAPLRFVDGDAMLSMIEDIAYRRGLGNVSDIRCHAAVNSAI